MEAAPKEEPAVGNVLELLPAPEAISAGWTFGHILDGLLDTKDNSFSLGTSV